MLSVVVWWLFIDHLLIKAWLCEKSWLCGRDFIRPHTPKMVETGICGKVLRVAPFRVCHFLLEKGGVRYGALMLNLCGCSNLIFLCGCCLVIEGPQIKVPKDRGVAYSCSSYLVTKVTWPCVGRELVKFSGRPARGDPIGSRKFLSLTICWKSKEAMRAPYDFNCITCLLRR